MPPLLALLALSVFVAATLIADSRRQPRMSFSLWVPLAWFLILASRPVVLWLHPGTVSLGAGVEDGNPIDRAVLSLLMLAAAIILLRRGLNWPQSVKQNLWLFLFLGYCGLSIVWSDFPAIAFKRWIRALGSVAMILVVLSEREPLAAIATLARRCAYILVPLSIVLMKYYRGLSVGYNYWTGQEILVGATTDKNALGRLCLISGLFALWELTRAKGGDERDPGLVNRVISFTIFAATMWLLVSSKSATSLAVFLLGCGGLLALNRPLLRSRVKHLGLLIVIGGLLAIVVGSVLDLPELVVASLGRDMTFTDRTFIWSDLLALNLNPIVGVGYDSLWLGERLKQFVRVHQVNEAHNGYLEVYLELGAVGLCLMAGLLFSAYRKAQRSLVSSFDYGRLRLVLLFVFLLYNVTEAGYKATTSIAFVFLLIAIDFPVRRYAESMATSESAAGRTGPKGLSQRLSVAAPQFKTGQSAARTSGLSRVNAHPPLGEVHARRKR